MAGLAEFDFFNRAVQGGLTEGQFVNAESILIAFGAPSLGAMSIADPAGGGSLSQAMAFPAGLVQQFSLNFNLAWQRLFEVGSKRSFFIPGRAVGALGLGKAYYHGPSLLRVAYAYMSKSGTAPGSVEIPALYEAGDVMSNLNPHEVRLRPGSGNNGNLWMNLASDVFSQPTGLLLIVRDSNDATVGAFYFEYSVVPSHSFGFDAQSVVVQEQMQLMFERMVPINHTGILPLYGGVGDGRYGIVGRPVGLNA